MGKRKPRVPSLPKPVAEGEEAILARMSGLLHCIEEDSKSAGWGDFSEAGLHVWELVVELELANPRHPNTVAVVIGLAEAGNVWAQRALRTYVTKLLEDSNADLPSSVRAYLVRSLNGRLPPHPLHQTDFIKNLFRDYVIRIMVDIASEHWSLPKLHSSGGRHSAEIGRAHV